MLEILWEEDSPWCSAHPPLPEYACYRAGPLSASFPAEPYSAWQSAGPFGSVQENSLWLPGLGHELCSKEVTETHGTPGGEKRYHNGDPRLDFKG